MEPIGLSSGLLTLTIFAFQSSQTLYQVVSSYQNHGREVRDLRNQVGALNGVLQCLQETLARSDLDLTALQLPLQCCGRACQDLTQLIEKCAARSTGSRTSFRDWFKTSYKSKDIAAFTSLIAGYQATISIALADANIRTSTVTAKLLQEYKAMIGTTTSDLEIILHDLDAEIGESGTTTAGPSLDQANESTSASQEERASIQQCLRICMDVSAHIDQVRSGKLADVAALPRVKDSGADAVDRPKLVRMITDDALQDCNNGLGLTTLQLRARLRNAERRLANTLRHENTLQEGFSDPQMMRDELDGVRQCLSICADAADEVAKERINVFEDVSTAEDGHQIIVSTMGDLISAKRVSVGARSHQWLGQMSDATIQNLSQNYPSREGNGIATAVEPAQVIKGIHFENRHGMGKKLST